VIHTVHYTTCTTKSAIIALWTGLGGNSIVFIIVVLWLYLACNNMFVLTLCFFANHFCCQVSRLTVVSREAKKEQSNCQKQNEQRTTVCLLQERMFSSFDVIITVNISHAVLTSKPALKTQNLLANINQHPKPAWSRSMNFVFTFFFFDRSSQFPFLNRHISLFKTCSIVGFVNVE